jgi:hypothetical protein
MFCADEWGAAIFLMQVGGETWGKDGGEGSSGGGWMVDSFDIILH